LKGEYDCVALRRLWWFNDKIEDKKSVWNYRLLEWQSNKNLWKLYDIGFMLAVGTVNRIPKKLLKTIEIKKKQ
jgi:hypothetical protein